MLVGLQSLLNCYIPAVFQLGYQVRTCTWEGRERQTGHKAREVLLGCTVVLESLLETPKNSLCLASCLKNFAFPLFTVTSRSLL